MKIMSIMSGVWARGAEMCTLYLFEQLYELGHMLRVHVKIRSPQIDAMRAGGFSEEQITAHCKEIMDMDTYLLADFKEIAYTTTSVDYQAPTFDPIAAIDEFRPDILIYSFNPEIVEIAAKSRTKPKTFVVLHGVAENDFVAYSENTDVVVCVSEYAKRLAERVGVPPFKLAAIPNGVPFKYAVSKRYRWKIPGEAWVWCFVGGLTELKRPGILIEALERRADKKEYAIFAGVEDLNLYLQDRAKDLGVFDRCRFLGHVDCPQDIYMSSNALVITSSRESMPLTMLEAMMCGRPVVANAVGGIPEVLADKSFAAVCDVTNVEEFDAALDRIKGLDSDEASFQAHSTWQLEYTSGIMAEKYQTLFLRYAPQ